MKIVLAYEGMDGSGKTSLAAFTKKLCEQHNQRFTLVGRREPYSTPVVNRITKVLHEEAANLSPHGDIFIRMAREYQRAYHAVSAPSGVVVIDRFILSLLALVRHNGHDADPIVQQMKEITARAHLHATLFVYCPFDVARGRVQDRNPGVPVKKTRDEKFLRKMAEHMETDFQRGLLTGQQWRVDNSQALAAAEDQLANFLLPYLQKP